MMADDDHHHHHHQPTAVTTGAAAFFLHHQEQELHGDEQEDDNNGGGEEDLLLTDGPNHHHPTTFSQLLFSSSHHQPHNASAATTSSFGLNDINSIYHLHNNTSSSYPPQMLCFGSTDPQGLIRVLPSPKINTITPSSNRKREGLTQEQSLNSVAVNSSNATDSTNCGPPPEARQRASKRSRTDKSTPSPRPRKEKLGERIATLQQLVSPFGKTDTASVLHEAMGYIRFLQDQIQVLCSPYLQPPPPSTSADSPQEGNSGVVDNKNKKRELRSRGLCLVPVECTIHVANSNNGADFWSPAAAAAAAAMGTNHNITSTSATTTTTTTTATSSCFLTLPTKQ